MVDSAARSGHGTVWPDVVALLAFNAFFRCAGYAMACFNMRRNNPEVGQRTRQLVSNDRSLDMTRRNSSVSDEEAESTTPNRRPNFVLITNQYQTVRQFTVDLLRDSCHSQGNNCIKEPKTPHRRATQ